MKRLLILVAVLLPYAALAQTPVPTPPQLRSLQLQSGQQQRQLQQLKTVPSSPQRDQQFQSLQLRQNEQQQQLRQLETQSLTPLQTQQLRLLQQQSETQRLKLHGLQQEQQSCRALGRC